MVIGERPLLNKSEHSTLAFFGLFSDALGYRIFPTLGGPKTGSWLGRGIFSKYLGKYR